MISKNFLRDSSTTSCHWEVAIPYEMSSFFVGLKVAVIFSLISCVIPAFSNL